VSPRSSSGGPRRSPAADPVRRAAPAAPRRRGRVLSNLVEEGS
jgi:hypothetical protein